LQKVDVQEVHISDFILILFGVHPQRPDQKEVGDQYGQEVRDIGCGKKRDADRTMRLTTGQENETKNQDGQYRYRKLFSAMTKGIFVSLHESWTSRAIIAGVSRTFRAP